MTASENGSRTVDPGNGRDIAPGEGAGGPPGEDSTGYPSGRGRHDMGSPFTRRRFLHAAAGRRCGAPRRAAPRCSAPAAATTTRRRPAAVAATGFGDIAVQLSWIKNIEFAGVYVADSEGYYKDEGFGSVEPRRRAGRRHRPARPGQRARVLRRVRDRGQRRAQRRRPPQGHRRQLPEEPLLHPLPGRRPAGDARGHEGQDDRGADRPTSRSGRPCSAPTSWRRATAPTR